jgi:hypothetical protein
MIMEVEKIEKDVPDVSKLWNDNREIRIQFSAFHGCLTTLHDADNDKVAAATIKSAQGALKSATRLLRLTTKES